MSDGWLYPPFELTVDPKGTGKLFGRGSSDDKGPILGWVNVIEAHVKLGLEMPVSKFSCGVLRNLDRTILFSCCCQVNLKMCFEGMEESGSEGLDELISEEKDKFFKGVDCVCISGKATFCISLSARVFTDFRSSLIVLQRQLL